MGTKSITLSPEIERFVTEEVESGQYATEDEAVNALLEKEMRRKSEFAWLKEQVALGLEQAERGEFVEFDAEKIKVEGRKRLAACKQP
jgi:antitoxin ParD1/3/4